MPESPDLVYLEKKLNQYLPGQTIAVVEVREPIVMRMLLPGKFAEELPGSTISAVRRHGPFLVFDLSEEKELIIHLMLAGRLHWVPYGNTKIPHVCALSLACEPSHHYLHYTDDKRMGKIYLAQKGRHDQIPRFTEQGPDLLTPAFTLDNFKEQLKKSRKQVRVLIMDQTIVSCIGNAYADEILFVAGIHPKTFCYQLIDAEIEKLFNAIGEVMRWGMAEVERAQQPLEVKVRDHMRVRNRKDRPCPNCGTKIRRAGVLGFDSFFCPQCQPHQRSQFIDWRKLPPS
ncbi:MAG: Fpg/Nei family DNA glycosylase [bacterium]